MSATEIATWATQLFATIDSMEPDALMPYFADDSVFRFGNAPPASGRSAIRAAVAAFFGEIGGLRHSVTGMWTGRWERGRVLAIEAEVTYTRRDGTRTPALPVTSTLRLEGDLIKDYRIFMDISPLFAAH